MNAEERVQNWLKIGNDRDQAYVRGVSQALALAYRVIAAGGTAEDIGALADEAMEMRFARDYHPAFLDELQSRVHRKSVTSGRNRQVLSGSDVKSGKVIRSGETEKVKTQ